MTGYRCVNGIVRVDIHNMYAPDAKKFLERLLKTVGSEVREIEVIHGFHGGTVLQHLVAAKLCLILPEGSFEIHGASVADGPTDRNGDFVIGNTVIHCTTMPGALLIEKCKANLRAGCHPVIEPSPAGFGGIEFIGYIFPSRSLQVSHSFPSSIVCHLTLFTPASR